MRSTRLGTYIFGKASAVGAGARWVRCGRRVGQLFFCGAPLRGVLSEAPLDLAVRGAELGHFQGHYLLRP